MPLPRFIEDQSILQSAPAAMPTGRLIGATYDADRDIAVAHNGLDESA
jgi:hypothetical protein